MSDATQTGRSRPYDDEIDLRALFRVVWNGKWLFGTIASVATIIAAIVAVLLPNIYRAEALLAPDG